MKSSEELKALISNIEGIDEKAIKRAIKYNNKLAKPINSMGELENIAIKISGITGKIKNNIKKKRVIVFASDNGVTEEGVSTSPVSVTKAQAINLTKGITGCASLAKCYKTEVKVYDVGIISDVMDSDVINKKISYGTNNFTKGPALTKEEATKAIFVGLEAVKEAKEEGIDLIGVGEMGIGNTTTSSAVLSVLLDKDVKSVTGYGAGLTEELYNHKVEVIKRGIEVNKPDSSDVIDVLSKVGGLDLCAMTGAFLGAGLYKIPVVIDGLISAVAAVCSYILNKNTVDYMFASHASIEPGYKVAMDYLGLKTFLDLDMHLGEGSGCPIAFEVIKGACFAFSHMATFKQAEINDSYLDILRK